MRRGMPCWTKINLLIMSNRFTFLTFLIILRGIPSAIICHTQKPFQRPHKIVKLLQAHWNALFSKNLIQHRAGTAYIGLSSSTLHVKKILLEILCISAFRWCNDSWQNLTGSLFSCGHTVRKCCEHELVLGHPPSSVYLALCCVGRTCLVPSRGLGE